MGKMTREAERGLSLAAGPPPTLPAGRATRACVRSPVGYNTGRAPRDVRSVDVFVSPVILLPTSPAPATSRLICGGHCIPNRDVVAIQRIHRASQLLAQEYSH